MQLGNGSNFWKTHPLESRFKNKQSANALEFWIVVWVIKKFVIYVNGTKFHMFLIVKRYLACSNEIKAIHHGLVIQIDELFNNFSAAKYCTKRKWFNKQVQIFRICQFEVSTISFFKISKLYQRTVKLKFQQPGRNISIERKKCFHQIPRKSTENIFLFNRMSHSNFFLWTRRMQFR